MNHLIAISNMYFVSCSSLRFEMNRQYLDPLPRLHTTSAWLQSWGLPLQVSHWKLRLKRAISFASTTFVWRCCEETPWLLTMPMPRRHIRHHKENFVLDNSSKDRKLGERKVCQVVATVSPGGTLKLCSKMLLN